MAPALQLIRSIDPRGAPAQEQAPRAWALGALVGRLTELSSARSGAQLTFAIGLVREAQLTGETAAWIGPRSSSFFPPDAMAGGVDLAALPMVRLPSAQEMGRAADQLLRSGAFGFLCLDLGHERLADPLLTRLLGLAQKHAAAVLFLTEKPGDAPSLSSLISLRAEVQRTRRGSGQDAGRFVCELRALKDKRRSPGWTFSEEADGPAGLR